MSNNEYVQVDIPSSKALILSSKIKDLHRIDAIFFDCDGVLIDVRESYDATIIETVRFLAKKLMAISVPPFLQLQRAILELRKSGGFNNDWCVSYALLLGIYCYVQNDEKLEPLGFPKIERGKILDGIEHSAKEAKDASNVSISESWQNVSEKIVQLGIRADSSGIVSVERALNDEKYEATLKSAKGILGYPVESSKVGRVFDEMFYGRELFFQKFEIEPEFYDGDGFVEMETPAINQETLNRLITSVGKQNIGIISGRDHISASKTLGSLIKNFESENLFFLGERLHSDVRKGKRTDPLLNKPNPEILIQAMKNLGDIQRCLYVGDSAEDLLMVQRANKIVSRFAFVGVYNLVNFKDEMRSYFLENGADAILPSVNDLPELMNLLGEWKQ